MKKLSGFDLNGWRDSAARNWIIQPDGDETEVPSSFVEGGLNGVVVQTGAIASAAFVGGAQASLAPHGLGDGWGAIGAGGKRIRVRDVIAGSGTIEHLAAAFRGMVPNADFGVACLDDHPGTTELLQERLLEALRKARTRTPLLVWRPVLAALHAIEHGLVDQGQTVGVVCHAAEGFTLQRLRIRRESSRGQTVLAPERRAVGRPRFRPGVRRVGTSGKSRDRRSITWGSARASGMGASAWSPDTRPSCQTGGSPVEKRRLGAPYAAL